MSDIAAISSAMAAALTAMSPTLRVLPFLSDGFVPPIALIGIDTTDPHSAFAKQAKTDFKICLILARSVERAALKQLQQFMDLSGSTSIIHALEQDQTLGGVVATLKVSKAGPPVPVLVNGNPYISCIFAVSVWHGDS